MNRISQAIQATKRLAPGYFEKCLTQRSLLSDQSAGSGYDLTPEAIEVSLLAAFWEPYEHPEVKAPCFAFRALLKGRFGLVRLDVLPSETVMAFSDPKGTGFVEVEVAGGIQGPKTDFTIIILGPEGNEEVVFTFHPGAPIRPSRISAEGHHGQTVTVQEALKLGFEWAKIVQAV